MKDANDPLNALSEILDVEMDEVVAKVSKEKKTPTVSEEATEKKGFFFYTTAYKAILRMPRNLRHRAFDALIRYGLFGEMPPVNTPNRIMQSFESWKGEIDGMERNYQKKVQHKLKPKKENDCEE